MEEKKEGCFSYLTYDTEEEEGDFNEEFWDPSADEEEYVQILDTFKAFEIIKYIIVEDWFFDKRRSKMDVRIISITPVCTYEFGLLVDGEIETEAVDEKELGTFFYPEIRNLLANHKIYNSQNMMSRMSFDEFFQRRLFASHITAENVSEFIIHHLQFAVNMSHNYCFRIVLLAILIVDDL